MKILVCNVGSTSLKFKLYAMPECRLLAQSKVERVGSVDDAVFQFKNFRNSHEINREKVNIPDYRTGINTFLEYLTDTENGVISSIGEIDRVGYKATLSKNHFGVHELTDEVMDGMREWLVLAKLHNTAYLETISAMREVLPRVLFVGTFESGFHQNIPLERRLYGVPYEWYEKYGVQRLGYHGASHAYIADKLNEDCSTGYRAISCHLGGSSSVCAIQDGKSVDTSFGMSLQSGLIHANRVGDMDCDLYEFLAHEGLSDDEIRDGFQKRGGLLGISGISNDLRYIEKAAEKGNSRARLAIDVFISGIVHYIGAFYVDLGGLDYLVFTGGIGEKSDMVRREVCRKLSVLGVALDEQKNRMCRGSMDLSGSTSSVKICVIPTDEELGIAKRTYEYTT
ncbi:acetate/propionate family kinase [Sediminispirochaeta smaragdinae]|uniref:Acetate kinase n=1 Tax=Sediminispirochaeta smaragdinae (strain DSM 11293 / JCM 15392 / SEBR 4228) TaxID=573413 RepID=E1R4D1_SEDSS|nr:acetate/propionate family kinase [Sediminispirochaeta smaragdinae]ADK81672.1 acetate kinase [Sediminispirochaeta smaragdinae DSM 11293]